MFAYIEGFLGYRSCVFLDSRCVLLILTIIAMEAVYVLEQPSSSLIMSHDRFVWLLDLLKVLGINEPWDSLEFIVCFPHKMFC